jgi:hypothetical protein
MSNSIVIVRAHQSASLLPLLRHNAGAYMGALLPGRLALLSFSILHMPF